MKRVAVIQSNYLPWKGYFDIIHDVDLFIFYDDVQYTKNDWRNRNKIKTTNGTTWLTIPTGTSADRLICDVEINDHRWQQKHWKSIKQYYSRSPFFNAYSPFFEKIYLEKEWCNLTELNKFLVREIAQNFLSIDVEFRDSREYGPEGQKFDRLLDLLKKVGAGSYVSGPAAMDYFDEEAFAAAGIDLIYKDYSGYPEYGQFHPPFEHSVSILDLLFHAGKDAPHYIWGWRNQRDD